MVDVTMINCVFCSMVEGEAPSYKIAEDALSFAILDINPFSKGHCLA
jgi:histidine triad (HIT) family protein